MKKGLIKEIVKDFEPYFKSTWKCCGISFMRRAGDWIQIVSFNPSRFDDTYEPLSSGEYLKRPGPIVGAYLHVGLRNKRNSVHRRISFKEHASTVTSIYQDMVDQFRPSIVAPLDLNEIKDLLRQQTEYWPHVYALCVMAAEEGSRADAHHWFEQFCKLMEDRPYDWAVDRRKELDEVMALMDSPDALKAHLAKIEQDKLASEKLAL